MIFKCKKCLYSWLGRLQGKIPAECPNCKSRKWNQKKNQ